MWTGAKKRALKAGVAFNLLPADIVIPAVCPVLGIPLSLKVNRGHHADDSPSLDRFDPRGGYVKDNVRVISLRANRLKSDGSAAEHAAIVRYMEGVK